MQKLLTCAGKPFSKVGLVTGGTSGIGRDAAVLFAKAGAKVVVAGRREVEGEVTNDLIRAAGGEGMFVKTDVSQAAEVGVFFAAAGALAAGMLALK